MPRKYRKKITVTLYHTEGFFVCAVWLLKKSKVEEVQILVHFFFSISINSVWLSRTRTCTEIKGPFIWLLGS